MSACTTDSLRSGADRSFRSTLTPSALTVSNRLGFNGGYLGDNELVEWEAVGVKRDAFVGGDQTVGLWLVSAVGCQRRSEVCSTDAATSA